VSFREGRVCPLAAPGRLRRRDGRRRAFPGSGSRRLLQCPTGCTCTLSRSAGRFYYHYGTIQYLRRTHRKRGGEAAPCQPDRFPRLSRRAPSVVHAFGLEVQQRQRQRNQKKTVLSITLQRETTFCLVCFPWSNSRMTLARIPSLGYRFRIGATKQNAT
jgi:hypothetical protein